MKQEDMTRRSLSEIMGQPSIVILILLKILYHVESNSYVNSMKYQIHFVH
jgi:hypothetical protein